MRTRNNRALLWAIGLTVAIAAPTLAQDSKDDDKSAIDEIIVTTMKREENVQDVPVPVTVIGQEYLKVAAPQNLLDASGLAPNVFIGSQTAGPGIGAIYSRGQGYADVEKSQSPAFGVMVDGVSFGTNTGQLTDLFDVQQIEINRGPQGLLYGKNTTAGVIDVKRTRPTEDMGVRAQFTYGSFDEYSAKAVLNSGRFLNDMAALKLGVQYREADGFYENLYDGSSLGDIESFLFTVGLAIDPTEDLSIYLVFDYMNDESETPPVQAENTLLPVMGMPAPGANGLDPHDSLADIDQPTDYETMRISGEINWDTMIGTITSVSAYITATDDVFQDFDSTCFTDLQGRGCPFNPNPRFPFASLHTNRMQTYRQFSQELRLASEITERIRTIVGGYYYESSLQLTQFTDNNLQLGIPGLGVPAGVLPGVVNVQDSHVDTESSALFANVEFDITEDITFSAGARYISENFDIQSLFYNTTRAASLTPGTVTAVTVPQFTDWASFNEVISRFGFDWQVTDDHLVYISRSEGFRSGGFSIRGTLSENFVSMPPQANFTAGERFNTFEPESVETYELGSKNVFFDGDLIVNGNVFYEEIDGYQANFVVITPGAPRGTNTYNNNYDEVSGWGLELEVQAEIPWVEGLSVNASAGYQDIEIDEALIDARRVPVGPGGSPGTAAQGSIDFTNTPLSRTPDWNWTLSVLYDTELSNGMGIGGQITYRDIDDFALGNLGNIADTENGYGILDLSAFLQVTENIRLGFFARNLTDEEYRANALASVGFQSFARPRTFFGQVTVEF